MGLMAYHQKHHPNGSTHVVDGDWGGGPFRDSCLCILGLFSHARRLRRCLGGGVPGKLAGPPAGGCFR